MLGKIFRKIGKFILAILIAIFIIFGAIITMPIWLLMIFVLMVAIMLEDEENL